MCIVTRKDIPQLARILYRECERVRAGGLQVSWSLEEAGAFLGAIWEDPTYHIEVVRTGNTIQAVCGGKLFRPFLPPHPLTVVEWLWWGATKKDTVAVWAACKRWGKSQGAEYAQYALAQPQRVPHKFIETYQWIRL